MGNNYLKYFLIYFIYLFDNYNSLKVIEVSQTIFEQATYYETNNSIIYGSFIDFGTLKFYKIDMNKIHHTISTPNFEFYFDEDDRLSIQCKKEKKIKCNTIILDEHEYISFDYDYQIAKSGGVLTFLLILYGVFSLFKGIIYYNLTIAFYSAFSLILFFREICEFLELLKILDTEDDASHRVFITFYIFTLITSLIYGYICFLSRYLKYISFGFIDGLILGKLLFYFIVQLIDEDIELKYFITELVCCIVFIIFWLRTKNKVINLTMFNIALIATYGIIYGFNLILGGLPFIPFFILAKYYHKEEQRDELFNNLLENNYFHIYFIFSITLIVVGTYFNITNYKIIMEKARKKIAVY